LTSHSGKDAKKKHAILLYLLLINGTVLGAYHHLFVGCATIFQSFN